MKEGLRQLWIVWQKFGHFTGNLIGRLVLTLFYFTIFMPFGVGTRLFSDRLEVKNGSAPRWISRQTGDLTLEDARKLS